MNFKGMSAQQLESLSKAASRLAKALRSAQPSPELALENGMEDHSYPTVRWGIVGSYFGKVKITMEDGREWLAIGHGPEGDAECIHRHGWIEFRPLD